MQKFPIDKANNLQSEKGRKKKTIRKKRIQQFRKKTFYSLNGKTTKFSKQFTMWWKIA
jgi:hypothetical protein